MATSTPTIQAPGVTGPVRSVGQLSDTRCIVSFTMGTYPTGGSPLTLPDEVKGLDLKAVHVLTPISKTGANRYYGWNGDAASPTILAMVASTGAEVANDTNLSAVTIKAELIFGG